MSLRQQIASSIASGNLTHNPNVETGADRIGALARCNKLGAALWRLANDNDRTAWLTAQELLHIELFRPIPGTPMPRREALCSAIILAEFWEIRCRKCEGKKFVMAGGTTMQACSACDGTGVGRHSDADRCRELEIDRKEYGRRWESLFAKGHQILSVANDKVEHELAFQLERGRK